MDKTLALTAIEGIRRVERIFSRTAWDDATEPDRLAVRDQGYNRGAVALVLGLLSVFRNVNGLVVGLRRGERFDLRTRYGLDPAPLDHRNVASRVFVETVRSILSGYQEDVAQSRVLLLEHLRAIQSDRLLGRQTAGKLAYIREIAGVALRRIGEDELAQHLVHLRRRTLVLLNLQRHRLSQSGRPTAAVERMVERIQSDVAVSSLRSHKLRCQFTNYPELAYDVKEMFLGFPKLFDTTQSSSSDTVAQFCELYADELAQRLGSHLPAAAAKPFRLCWRTGHGIEVTFTPRDESFLTLGDAYGDCTARKVRSQVDPRIANIHWTVYSWLLDPFYRVLEVTSDGTRAIKAHLLPLLIHDRPVLAVDAIEVVPTLRDRLGHRPNEYISDRLFEQRDELISTLFDSLRELGHRMGAEAVYVDKFSNAAWVRATVDALPSFGYHIRDVTKPFGVTAVRSLIHDILGQDFDVSDVAFEIQATNLALMDQGLREGFKEVGVLEGDGDEFIPVRGP